MIAEPVLSAGGFIIPPLGWLARVRDICDDLEVLMISDEVITGFGRTGKWFGVQHEDVVPDLMSVAKGITSGYLPLSASIARAKLADAFDGKSHEENVHPGTYAGHPTSCAAAPTSRCISPSSVPADATGARRSIYLQVRRSQPPTDAAHLARRAGLGRQDRENRLARPFRGRSEVAGTARDADPAAVSAAKR